MLTREIVLKSKLTAIVIVSLASEVFKFEQYCQNFNSDNPEFAKIWQYSAK